jgi:hypothetical protein
MRGLRVDRRLLCGEAACFVGEEESLEDLSDGLSFLVAQAVAEQHQLANDLTEHSATPT